VIEEVQLTLDIGVKNKLKAAILKGNEENVETQLQKRSAETIIHAKLNDL
jgi:hypothetical protein